MIATRGGVDPPAFQAMEEGLGAFGFVNLLVAVVVVKPQSQNKHNADGNARQDKKAEVQVEQGGGKGVGG